MRVNFEGDGFLVEELTRVALETGLLVTSDGVPIEVRVVNALTVGVRTVGPNDVLVQVLHREVMAALTEENPMWTEYRKDINRWRKPKDLGCRAAPGVNVVELHWGTRAEAERFARNRARVIRAVVHAFVHAEVLRHR